MYKIKGRVNRLICEVGTLLNETLTAVTDIEIRPGRLCFPCNICDITDNFTKYSCGEIWSTENYDDYALFRFKVNIPSVDQNTDCYLNITTNKSGGHNMVRPQMLLFAGNEVVQGIDTNHENVKITEFSGKGAVWFYVYAFSGLAKKTPYGAWVDIDTSDGVRLYVNLQTRRKTLSNFYYNTKTPYTYL